MLWIHFSVIWSSLSDNVSRKYGPCVERVYVHKPDPNAPALFGKIVFNTALVTTVIMNTLHQAKFNVDGKPLWCKRFDLSKKHGGEQKWFYIMPSCLIWDCTPLSVIVLDSSVYSMTSNKFILFFIIHGEAICLSICNPQWKKVYYQDDFRNFKSSTIIILFVLI